ncbi:hypothetical protein I3843_15G148900 [Carya illinoinensis]|nr:hypothetical protein I3843_15G148900 [Carya illinoinensis]KAG7945384.1 hypothetical protein I3843_15G148900 [Carya illinoinensis]
MTSSMSFRALSSSSYSTNTSPWLYDAFLSFRGEDTRNTFIAHLHHALLQNGIHTYIDEDELRRGDEISLALLQAIENSRLSIIVLSENYASSTWCLDELLNILNCKETKQQIVLPIFYHVNPSEVRNQRGNFGEALAVCVGKFNEDVKKVQRWKAALQEVANLAGYELENGNESKFIQEIVQEVSRIVNYSYLYVSKYLVGMESHVQDIDLLLSIGMNDIRMVGIFGVGGIDMGREIVRKESCKEPGARSRLWFHEDVRYVLEENALIDFKMYRGCIKEISGQFQSLTVMEFCECKFLTKIPDLSSCSNLKELHISKCKNLVKVHDSVGFLDKLVRLSLNDCSSLKSFPRCLKLRSLEDFVLWHCKKLRNFPEIECKMERLSCIILVGTAIKELPSSIGCLTPALNALCLRSCTKLMHLPSSIHHLQNLKESRLGDCINVEIEELASSINGCFTGIEELSIEDYMDLMHLPISISHLQHLKILYLDNYRNLAIEEIRSSIGHLTGLKKLHLTTSKTIKRSEPESSDELLLSSLYWYLDDYSFYCSSTLQELDLSWSAIVSLPPSIKRFVELRILRLWHCEKLQEILHIPPNIQELYASECFSLERFPEVSTKFQFHTSCGLRDLRWIDLSGCHKLLANIGSQVPNPLVVEEHIQDHSCGIIFPENKIPDWFSHTKEPSNRDSCELDICGPLYLDEIIGIVFCAVLGSNPDDSPSGIRVSINGNMLVEANFELLGDCNHVYLNYSFPECIEQWQQYPTGDNLRFIFDSNEEAIVMFKSCGVHIIYKYEENESLTVGECSVDSSSGIQLCKRHRDIDEDHNLEFNRYPQHKRRSQNLSNSNVVVDCTSVDSDFTEAEEGSEGSLKEEEVPVSRSTSQEDKGNSEKAY